jgi:hypothetical protein
MLLKQDGKRSKQVVFYDGTRCDIKLFDNVNIHFIEYTRWGFLKFFILSCFRRPDEVCVPHFKGGRLIRVYSKFAKKVSAIDDGLDTFRELPRNIVITDFKLGSNYYTFNYDIRLASWISHFNLVNVCELEEIAKSTKKTLDLNNFDVVLVESPGIESAVLPDFKSDKVLLVKHSNPNKNIKRFQHYASINGADFALEESIKNYKGILIVGESMTAIYALMLESPAFRLMVAVNNDNNKNLTSLLELVSKKEFAELLVSK